MIGFLHCIFLFSIADEKRYKIHLHTVNVLLQLLFFHRVNIKIIYLEYGFVSATSRQASKYCWLLFQIILCLEQRINSFQFYYILNIFPKIFKFLLFFSNSGYSILLFTTYIRLLKLNFLLNLGEVQKFKSVLDPSLL